MKKIIFTITALFISATSFANDTVIKQALEPFHVTNMQISDSPINGLKLVVSDQGIFYATPDGKYFLQGSLVEMTDKGPVDISNRPLMKSLEDLSNEMIVYPAKDQKYVVNVFTDITCPYCLKLHNDIQKYNDLGITIRYLAFPRAGGNSKVAGQMEAIWTAKDPKAAFTEVEKNKKFPKPITPKVVSKQYDLGLQFNVNGTPALVFENGALLSGYHTPDELLSILQSQ